MRARERGCCAILGESYDLMLIVSGRRRETATLQVAVLMVFGDGL